MIKSWTDEKIKEVFNSNAKRLKELELEVATLQAENTVFYYEAMRRELQLIEPAATPSPLTTEPELGTPNDCGESEGENA